ncbi:hypothetical protein [Pelobacter propionicus]|uniref:hypothetical protein n=1 Tax=Pelobacter propionicus TaxID=29543 RepID=UPI0012EDDEC0|nr:hypothetical protein [Pelobacter propionicus]
MTLVQRMPVLFIGHDNPARTLIKLLFEKARVFGRKPLQEKSVHPCTRLLHFERASKSKGVTILTVTPFLYAGAS